MTRKILITLLLAPVLSAQHKSFVACPIVRDTQSVPCFLAEHEGETYFLAIQQDIRAEQYPPQLLHEVLVEGTVAPGPRVCGGIPLNPIHLSVLPEVNPACNTILPAEPGIDPPPHRRPAGPSTQNIPADAPPAPAPAPPQRFTPPFTEREFKIEFDFDSAFLFMPDTGVVNQAVAFVRAAKPKQVVITAHRAAAQLSNGKVITEREAIAKERAAAVTDLVKGLGVDPGSVTVRVASEVITPDGITDFERRLVSIRVTP